MGSLNYNGYETGRVHLKSQTGGAPPFTMFPSARYLKIYNNTSGTVGLTLRAIMSDYYVYQ